LEIILGLIALLSLVSAGRIIIGPSLWDRLLGFNLLASKLMVIIILLAVLRDESFLLDMVLVYGLLGFVGVIFIAWFVQQKGRY